MHPVYPWRIIHGYARALDARSETSKNDAATTSRRRARSALRARSSPP
jgi:hypothetical protein